MDGGMNGFVSWFLESRCRRSEADVVENSVGLLISVVNWFKKIFVT